MDFTDENKGRVCHHCRKKIVDAEDDLNDETDINKCRKWLDSCNLSDLSDGSIYEENFISDASSTTTEENSLALLKNDNICFSDEIVLANNNNSIVEFEKIIDKKPNIYENINIYKSSNVHIGNVTHINGPVYINQFAPTINQNVGLNQNINQNNKFFIVSRRTWLAQPPLDPEDVKYLSQPAKFVIISHSATEEAYTQTDNNLIVRLIQQFHIESRKWNDISYNFLIGADGSIYEGRGWKVVGAHAFGYNALSLGICFIGCYIKKLPPDGVLRRVQDFIKYGVQIGAIAEDYKLLGHCQCSSTESPGQRLYEEIKTWDNWDGSVKPDKPSPLIQK